MDFLDIHSHILPNIDDGARNSDEAVKILLQMKEQGVTDVIATPHFNASSDDIEEFEEQKAAAKKHLEEKIQGMELPNIYDGCEVLYFTGMGSVESIKRLCIKNTNYLLLEFGFLNFDHNVLEDIRSLSRRFDIVPVIAHTERYFKFRGYKNLLHLIESGEILCQVNAASLFTRPFDRSAKKLLKKNLVSYLGSDAHSSDFRPPQIGQALAFIEKKYGQSTKDRLVINSLHLKKKLDK